MFTILIGNSFMNCKNVEMADVTEANNQSAKIRRQHKIPKITFKTLVINPMHDALRRTGENLSTDDGLKKAFHICRGHFRTYDESGAGLFGRGQTGRFWIHQHTRGKKEFGEVVKDYKIGKSAIDKPASMG